MAYLARLIHSAAVYRMTVTRSDTGVRAADYGNDPVSGMGAVACLLLEGDNKRWMESFGADIRADAVVLFAASTDVQPNVQQSDGKNDKLVITDENSVQTTWLVQAVRDPASARKLTVAAVVKARD